MGMLVGILIIASKKDLLILCKSLILYWSGQRGSNPRPSAWEADALPTELCPPSLLFDVFYKCSLQIKYKREIRIVKVNFEFLRFL